MNLKKFNLPLIILLLFTFLIRIYKIDNLSLFGDEIDVGYQAFSLLKTGHDYRGYFLPFYTESLSESRAPLLIYLTIPSVALFGLNEISVRLPPIIFGVLSIYFLYKLVLLLTKNYLLSSLTAFVLTINPWHYMYSRSAFEVTLLISLILAATYYFNLFIENSKNKYLYISIFIFGLTFYTYNTANIFTPLIVLYLLFTNKFLLDKLNRKQFLISIVLTLVLITPICKEIAFGKATERFSSLSIFKNQTIVDEIINKRNSFSSTSQSIERLYHNKATAISTAFLKNYFQSISPSFLFFNINQANLRHSISSTGLLFLTFFPLLIYGFFKSDYKNKVSKFFLFWLLVAPLPAALTLNGGTHPTRLFLMLVPLCYFISLGTINIFKTKNKVSLLILIIFSLSAEIFLFCHEYYIHYSKDTAKLWNTGYQEVFNDLNAIKSNNLFISNSNYNSLLPFLFYNQIVPTSIELDDHEKKNIYLDLDGFKISDKIFFINNWKHNNDIFEKIKNFSKKDDVFVLFQLNEIPGFMDLSVHPVNKFSTLKTVYNPDGTILAQIIQKNEE